MNLTHEARPIVTELLCGLPKGRAARREIERRARELTIIELACGPAFAAALDRALQEEIGTDG